MDTTRENKWSPLGLEFVVVAVGVVAGLAVDSWRQERADVSIVSSYLGSLERELAQDTFLTRVYIDLSEERSRSLRLLLDDLDGTIQRLSPNEELLALNWAYRADVPLYVSSVLEELLATGNARLLDPAVLGALQAVSERFRISDDVIGGLSFPLEEAVPGLVPGHMRRAIRESIRAGGRWVFDGERLRHAADSLLRGASAAEVASIQSWRSIPGLRRLLEQQAYSSDAYTEELEDNRDDLTTALELVATTSR